MSPAGLEVGAPTVCPAQVPRVRLGSPAGVGVGVGSENHLGDDVVRGPRAPGGLELRGGSLRALGVGVGLAFRRSLERFW